MKMKKNTAMYHSGNLHAKLQLLLQKVLQMLKTTDTTLINYSVIAYKTQTTQMLMLTLQQ